MSEIRLFTTDAAAVRTHAAMSAPVELIEVAGLDRPPPQLAHLEEEWPPIWVGVAADLSRTAPLRARPARGSRLTFALQGPDLLADPAIDESLRELQQEGYAVDVVVYLGGYGGER